MTIAGGILAGGKNTRMGTPKTGVPRSSDGRTMIEHVVAALEPIVDAIVVSGECPGFGLQRSDAKQVMHRDRNLGPLAGIEAVRSREIADPHLFGARDQPLLGTPLLGRLLLPARPTGGVPIGRWQAVPAFSCIFTGELANQQTHALPITRRAFATPPARPTVHFKAPPAHGV